MGYSCTQKAMNTLNKIKDKICGETANTWTKDGVEYFSEIGKENADGSITGSVFMIFPDDHKWKGRCQKTGSFKIDTKGDIQNFPHLPKGIKKELNEINNAPFVIF